MQSNSRSNLLNKKAPRSPGCLSLHRLMPVSPRVLIIDRFDSLKRGVDGMLGIWHDGASLRYKKPPDNTLHWSRFNDLPRRTLQVQDPPRPSDDPARGQHRPRQGCPRVPWSPLHGGWPEEGQEQRRRQERWRREEEGRPLGAHKLPSPTTAPTISRHEARQRRSFSI